MGSHPVNLTLRFILEILALLVVGIWAWKQGQGMLRIFLAIGIPVVIAVIWGVFAVPGDPSRSGQAVVAIPGILRLVLELGIFAFASWTLYDMSLPRISTVISLFVLIHYIASYDRIQWLLSH